MLAGGLEAAIIQLGFFLVHLGLVFFSKKALELLGKLRSNSIKEFREVRIDGKHMDRRDLMGDTRAAVSIERTSQDIEVGEKNYKGGVKLVGISSIALFDDGFVAGIDCFKEIVEMLAKHFGTFILGVIEDGGEGVAQFGRNQLFGTSFSNDFVASVKEPKRFLISLVFLLLALEVVGASVSAERTLAATAIAIAAASWVGAGVELAWPNPAGIWLSVEGRVPLNKSSLSVVDVEFLGGLVNRMDTRENCCWQGVCS
jgi:hypothetical protein